MLPRLTLSKSLADKLTRLKAKSAQLGKETHTDGPDLSVIASPKTPSATVPRRVVAVSPAMSLPTSMPSLECKDSCVIDNNSVDADRIDEALMRKNVRYMAASYTLAFVDLSLRTLIVGKQVIGPWGGLGCFSVDSSVPLPKTVKAYVVVACLALLTQLSRWHAHQAVRADDDARKLVLSMPLISAWRAKLCLWHVVNCGARALVRACVCVFKQLFTSYCLADY